MMRPGDVVAAEIRSARREPLRFAWSDASPLRFRETLHAPRELELWDRAPVNATPAGFKDPWWARNEHGAWYVVAWPRAGSRESAPTAYPCDDEVRLRLSMLGASPEVARAGARMLLDAAAYRDGQSDFAVGRVGPVRAVLGHAIA